MRYQASSCWRWTWTRPRWCERGTNRRPRRSQTKSVSSQPAKRCSLAWTDQPIGNEDERAVGIRHTLGLTEQRIEEVHRPSWSNRVRTARIGPQVEASRMSGSSASPASARSPPSNRWNLGRIATKILTAEIGDGPLLDLAVLTIGLNEADILVDCAAGGPDFDRSDVHFMKYHDGRDGNQAKNLGYSTR